jgi:Sulfotransferase domain
MLKSLDHIVNRLRHKAGRKGIDYDPHDRTVQKLVADRLFRQHIDDEPQGSIGRGRLLLGIIEDSFPSDALTAAYFENLELLLKSRQPRPLAGQLVLGLGAGRTGSTSLVEVLATAEGSCCTHENPPLISWVPQQIEIDFHIRRFKRLLQYFPLVADVSHWWINVLDEVFRDFSDAKLVGVYRDVDSCVKSFMRIKGFGRGSYNHWVPYGNGVWAAAQWDPTYPTYAVPEHSKRDPDDAKSELIARYVQEYNQKLHAIASRAPDKIILARTEELNTAAVQVAIFQFVGLSGRVIKSERNVGTMIDGRRPNLKF